MGVGLQTTFVLPTDTRQPRILLPDPIRELYNSIVYISQFLGLCPFKLCLTTGSWHTSHEQENPSARRKVMYLKLRKGLNTEIFKNMYNRQLFPKRCQCLFFKWISFSKAIDGLLLLVFSAFIHLNCETRRKFSLFICIPSPHVAVFYTLLLGCSFWAWAMSIVEITWFDFNTC